MHVLQTCFDNPKFVDTHCIQYNSNNLLSSLRKYSNCTSYICITYIWFENSCTLVLSFSNSSCSFTSTLLLASESMDRNSDYFHASFSVMFVFPLKIIIYFTYFNRLTCFVPLTEGCTRRLPV